MMDSSKISIFILRYRYAAVWDPKDAVRVKNELRVPGSLIGSLPRKPWQNQVMALPLLLSPEEVTLLVRKNYAVLYYKETISNKVNDDDVKLFNLLREKSHSDQIKIFVNNREEKKLKYANKSEEVPKDEKSVASSKNNLTHGGSILGQESLQESKDQQNPQEYKNDDHSLCSNTDATESDRKYFGKSTLIHMPTFINDNEWLTLEGGNTGYVWDYPNSTKERCHYAVYCDLWEKGYYLTAGGKFGCDYLVYPGDPTRYHSSFVVLVMQSSERVSPQVLLSYGRLGSGVKKTVVLAIVNENDNFQVKYQSMSWTSITQNHQ